MTQIEGVPSNGSGQRSGMESITPRLGKDEDRVPSAQAAIRPRGIAGIPVMVPRRESTKPPRRPRHPISAPRKSKACDLFLSHASKTRNRSRDRCTKRSPLRDIPCGSTRQHSRWATVYGRRLTRDSRDPLQNRDRQSAFLREAVATARAGRIGCKGNRHR